MKVDVTINANLGCLGILNGSEMLISIPMQLGGQEARRELPPDADEAALAVIDAEREVARPNPIDPATLKLVQRRKGLASVRHVHERTARRTAPASG